MKFYIAKVFLWPEETAREWSLVTVTEGLDELDAAIAKVLEKYGCRPLPDGQQPTLTPEQLEEAFLSITDPKKQERARLLHKLLSLL